MQHIEEFIKAMRDKDCAPSDPGVVMDDDKPHYYHIEGDKRGTKKGSYCLAAEDDGFAFGWFMSHREGEVHNWHSKGKRKTDPEARKAWRARVEAKRKEQDRRRAEAKSKARRVARDMWGGATKATSHPYLDRKGVSPKGLRVTDDGDLLVPMWRDGELVSVQQIKPDGDKLFLRDSDHVGAYYSIRGDMGMFAICEGMATGATVHDATGWSVIVAFNAGNLKPVAKSIRDKYPDARIVIAADNDHETFARRPDLGNVGQDKAQQAAVAIGGAQVISPPDDEGVSDWNDVAAKAGVGAVKDYLLSAPVAKAQGDADNWEPDDTPEIVETTDANTFLQGDVRPLGYNRGTYYFFPRSTGQIMEYSATALGRAQNLFTLAPRDDWFAFCGTEKLSEMCETASAALINDCHRKGIFQPEDARGVGVWREKRGKLLVNCGDVIIGEGVRCHPSEYKGDSVYEAGSRVIDMDVEPLSNREASAFRDICKDLSWKRGEYGDFLAGWVVIAAIGGAVDWRPHIFITGQKGSGKSTAMDKIVKAALDGIAIKRDGGTTEPGLRKAIGASSRPFIMDEAEAESAGRKAQMQAIFSYFRNASSGAVVENAYETYVARSCACFGAINPRIEQGADADRWSMLELSPNTAPDRDAHYKKLLISIRDVVDKDFPDRLLARTVANLDVLLHNIDVFVDVFSKRLGNKRAGDQIGTLVAGSHSLVSNKKVDFDFVEDWVSRQDWNFGELTGGGSDAETLVSYIMSARVRYDQDGMARESSVGELIQRATGPEDHGRDAAIKGLGGVGVKVDDRRIVISNSASRMRDLLRDTNWSASWKRTLDDYPGAQGEAVTYFAPGVKTRAMSIPLDIAMGLDDEEDVDNIPMEGFE